MEERHKNAEEVMWKFARMFGIGDTTEDPKEVKDALEELEKLPEKKAGETSKK